MEVFAQEPAALDAVSGGAGMSQERFERAEGEVLAGDVGTTRKDDLMASRDTTRGFSGWVTFAGAMMVIVGWLNFFYGLAAILNDTVVGSGVTARSSPTSPLGVGSR